MGPRRRPLAVWSRSISGSSCSSWPSGPASEATSPRSCRRDAGQLTILRSDQLDFAQDLAKVIENLVIVLLVLGLGTVRRWRSICPRGRRRETLRAIGFIFVIVGVLVLVMRSIGGGIVVDELAKTTAVEPAVEDVWSVGTSLLSEIAGNLIINGIIILLVAWVAGGTRPAIAVRRAAAPYMRDRPELTYGARRCCCSW